MWVDTKSVEVAKKGTFIYKLRKAVFFMEVTNNFLNESFEQL